MLGNRRGAFRKGTGDMNWAPEGAWTSHLKRPDSSLSFWQGTAPICLCTRRSLPQSVAFVRYDGGTSQAEARPWKPSRHVAFSAGTSLEFTLHVFCLFVGGKGYLSVCHYVGQCCRRMQRMHIWCCLSCSGKTNFVELIVIWTVKVWFVCR